MGFLSMAFCKTCGRWRSSKGKWLKGNCDPGAAQKTRLSRIREGKHPVNGRKFDHVQPAGNERDRATEGVLDHDIPIERVVSLMQNEDGHDRCGFDEDDWAMREEDEQAEQAMHGPFLGPEDEECEPPW